MMGGVIPAGCLGRRLFVAPGRALEDFGSLLRRWPGPYNWVSRHLGGVPSSSRDTVAAKGERAQACFPIRAAKTAADPGPDKTGGGGPPGEDRDRAPADAQLRRLKPPLAGLWPVVRLRGRPGYRRETQSVGAGTLEWIRSPRSWCRIG
jgi:hypothetical protein